MTHKRWLKFSLIITVTLFCICALIGKTVFIDPVYDTKILKLDQHAETLFAGASHSATGFNPNDYNASISVARSGEPLFFTFYKLKHLLKNNPQIKRVILGVGPMHIAQWSNQNLFAGNEGSRKFAMEYYSLVDNEDDPYLPNFSSDRWLAYLKYHGGVPLSYTEDLKVVLNYYSNHVSLSEYRFFGGFESESGTHLDPDELAKKAKLYFGGTTGLIYTSNVGAESIERIAKLSDQYNVQLFLINTPMHSNFRKEIPQVISQGFDKIIGEIDKKYSNTKYLNLSNFPLPDEYYLDGDHLNVVGAEFLSSMIQKILSDESVGHNSSN